MAYPDAIFDVDGVLVDPPHELAWREALKELLEGDWRDIRDRTSSNAERFTPRCTSRSSPASLGWQAPRPLVSTSAYPMSIGGLNNRRPSAGETTGDDLE
jgi:hypothetical protein